MKILFFISLLFFISCAKELTKVNPNNDFNSLEKMSFKEFKFRVDQYVKNNSYPVLDE